jgi:hypothetical protein
MDQIRPKPAPSALAPRQIRPHPKAQRTKSAANSNPVNILAITAMDG